MIANSYKTKKVVLGDNTEDILKSYLPKLKENSVVIITSKIVSICQGNIIKNDGKVTKEELVRQQAERIIKDNEYYKRVATLLTITNYIFTPSAGIDESNGNGYFILWPKNILGETEKIWRFLKKQYKVKNLGVIVIDSTFLPLRRGTIGIGLGWCGFVPVVNYIGTLDVFGEPMKYTRASVVDTLANVGSIILGEGNQQTPLAIIEDIPGITFVNRPPTKEEIKEMKIIPEDDMFSPLTNAAVWEKGQGKAH